MSAYIKNPDGSRTPVTHDPRADVRERRLQQQDAPTETPEPRPVRRAPGQVDAGAGAPGTPPRQRRRPTA